MSMQNTRAVIVLFIGFLSLSGITLGQGDGIEIVHVRGPIYFIGGAGANITASDRAPRNHATANHTVATTCNDPVPDRPRHSSRGLTPLRARRALHG